MKKQDGQLTCFSGIPLLPHRMQAGPEGDRSANRNNDGLTTSTSFSSRRLVCPMVNGRSKLKTKMLGWGTWITFLAVTGTKEQMKVFSYLLDSRTFHLRRDLLASLTPCPLSGPGSHKFVGAMCPLLFRQVDPFGCICICICICTGTSTSTSTTN